MVDKQLTRMRAREQHLTHARLVEMLDYDPVTGFFHWRKKPARRIGVGQRAGVAMGDGGRAVNIDKVRHYEHRLAWFYVHGHWPAAYIDHRNNRRSDNWIKNLRDGSLVQNQGNRRVQQNSLTGVKGVRQSPGRKKWTAHISRGGKFCYLGSFPTVEEAAQAYAAAAQEYFGDYASPTQAM